MDLALGYTRLIIDACKKQGLLRNQAAYVLATAYWESARTMKPVREMGGEKYLKSKPYYPYVGMGFVQLTWLANYEKASKKLGVNFVKNPKLLLEPGYAATILVIGSAEGWFTGKKLSDYITLSKSDFINARRIINGTDKAKEIAAFAQQYNDLLLREGYGVISPAKAPVAPSVANGLPAAPAENATVTIADGPKKDETIVVVAKTPQSPPASPGLPTSKTGFMAIGALILTLIAGAIRYMFGG